MPYKDRIYLTCWDRAMERLYLFTSNDGGSSWSPPTLVSRGYVQNGMVAVNNQGIVGVAWYDGRDDPRGYRAVFRCQHVYFTASLDGGGTFLPEVKVSTAENCPDTPQNAEAGRRWVAGGDYFGLAAAAEGSLSAAVGRQSRWDLPAHEAPPCAWSIKRFGNDVCQALNLPQPSVELVPTRENAAHHSSTFGSSWARPVASASRLRARLNQVDS